MTRASASVCHISRLILVTVAADCDEEERGKSAQERKSCFLTYRLLLRLFTSNITLITTCSHRDTRDKKKEAQEGVREAQMNRFDVRAIVRKKIKNLGVF